MMVPTAELKQMETMVNMAQMTLIAPLAVMASRKAPKQMQTRVNRAQMALIAAELKQMETMVNRA